MIEKPEFVKVRAVFKAQTEKAILLCKDDEEKWVPVSCLGIRDQIKADARDFPRNEECEVSIVDWWMTKVGWK